MPFRRDWSALVHYPAGGQKVVPILGDPRRGEVARSEVISQGWIYEKVKPRGGAYMGEPFEFEVWITRAEA